MWGGRFANERLKRETSGRKKIGVFHYLYSTLGINSFNLKPKEKNREGFDEVFFQNKILSDASITFLLVGSELNWLFKTLSPLSFFLCHTRSLLFFLFSSIFTLSLSFHSPSSSFQLCLPISILTTSSLFLTLCFCLPNCEDVRSCFCRE